MENRSKNRDSAQPAPSKYPLTGNPLLFKGLPQFVAFLRKERIFAGKRQPVLFVYPTGIIAMPSGYDDFSEKAHRNNPRIPEEQRRNSLILEKAMTKEGFIPYPTEWWHFDDDNGKNYPYADRPLCE